jgi:hypothetical protein
VDHVRLDSTYEAADVEYAGGIRRVDWGTAHFDAVYDRPAGRHGLYCSRVVPCAGLQRIGLAGANHDMVLDRLGMSNQVG